MGTTSPFSGNSRQATRPVRSALTAASNDAKTHGPETPSTVARITPIATTYSLPAPHAAWDCSSRRTATSVAGTADRTSRAVPTVRVGCGPESANTDAFSAARIFLTAAIPETYDNKGRKARYPNLRHQLPAAEDGTLLAPARTGTENRWLCQLQSTTGPSLYKHLDPEKYVDAAVRERQVAKSQERERPNTQEPQRKQERGPERDSGPSR